MIVVVAIQGVITPGLIEGSKAADVVKGGVVGSAEKC
jgi:hypothetical protein